MAQGNRSAEDWTRGSHESQMDRQRRIEKASAPERAARAAGRGKRQV